MREELVFSVDGEAALPATPIALSQAGLREVQHLQEWVLEFPEILGSDVMIVTSELADWQTASGGIDQERLDVLGLDGSGKLVVGELKRGVAPVPTTMQSIGYAARASRFTLPLLAEKHAQFLARRGEDITNEEAAERLNLHVEHELTPERLANPRIVLVASQFPAALTATAVWLTEQGLDITLQQFQAYRTEGQVLLTVSQLYPTPDVEEFTIAPRRRAVESDRSPEYPEVEWTAGEVAKLRSQTDNPTIHAVLDLCQQLPDTPPTFNDVAAEAGRTIGQARGDLAGLTMIVKRRFERENWPVTVEWDTGEARYRMAPELAAAIKGAGDQGSGSPSF